MSFDRPAGDYDRFMGRFSEPLAALLADAAGVASGMRVLDVGCGPGALTVEVDRRGADVAAIDPSEPFVAACRERVPGADVRLGTAEELPWPDDSFDAALSCLVVGFMRDPARGVAEMARTTRPGGTVALCFWDVSRHEMLDLAARTVLAVRPGADPHPPMTGVTRGDLAGLLRGAGLAVVHDGELSVTAAYDGFEDLWDSLLHSAGPIGDVMATLTEQEIGAAHAYARTQVPAGPFRLGATAWCAVGAR